MLRATALAVLLCVGTAAAEPPGDAPRTIIVDRAELRLRDGSFDYMGPGVCMDEAAAKNTARHIVELEQRPTAKDAAALVMGAVVLGFLGGVAAAKLLPAK